MGDVFVLEGAFQDTPSFLQYAVVEVPTPTNAYVLRIGKTRLEAIAYSDNLEEKDSFVSLERKSSSVKGWKIRDEANEGNPNWPDIVFPMPRSIVTLDYKTGESRIYMNEIHFREGFDYYFKAVPLVIKDSRNLLKGYFSEEEINSRRTRIL